MVLWKKLCYYGKNYATIPKTNVVKIPSGLFSELKLKTTHKSIFPLTKKNYSKLKFIKVCYS